MYALLRRNENLACIWKSTLQSAIFKRWAVVPLVQKIKFCITRQTVSNFALS